MALRGAVQRRDLVQRCGTHVSAATPALPHHVEKEIPLNGKEPCFQVSVAPSLAPAADGALQGVLDEIVRPLVVAQQGPRITPQGRNLRFEKGSDLIQGQWLTCRSS